MTAAVFLLLVLASSPEEDLPSVRFIANAGFELSDGSHTILVDFPYRSGAFGYMTYDPSELHARKDSLCLFTHRHADHFAADALSSIGCSVAGPSDVLAEAGSAPRLEGDREWKFGPASIRCIVTPHAGIGHCSYLITWQKRAIFIAGDVDELTSHLEGLDRLDLLLIPEWVSEEAPRIRDMFPTAKIVLAHYRQGMEISGCGGCTVLSQGERLRW